MPGCWHQATSGGTTRPWPDGDSRRAAQLHGRRRRGQHGQPAARPGIQEGGGWTGENTIPGLNSPAVTDFSPSADSSGLLVSCWAVTSCSVAGIYGDHHGNQQVFVADWTNGVWGDQTIPGSGELNVGGSAIVNALACAGTGSCAVGGQFLTAPASDPSAQLHALVDARAGGNWGNSQEILGISNLPDSDAVAASCPATGSCLTGARPGCAPSRWPRAAAPSRPASCGPAPTT
jgi:hypothetical protein